MQMPRFLLTGLVCLSMSPALAERELHGVGIYEGYERTGSQIHGPRADVYIDRPGAIITLYLADYGPVTWRIETAATTKIERIVLGGYQAEKTAIELNGIPYIGTDIVTLPYAYKPEGMNFRQLMEAAPEFGGFTQFDSFQGAYGAEDGPFDVDDETPAIDLLGPDYLAAQVQPLNTVPASLRDLVTSPTPENPAKFSSDALALSRADGTIQEFPVSLDVPQPSWPGGAVHVPQESALYGATFGGEGFLYRVDTETGVWSVETSMMDKDVHGMIFDPAQNRIVMAGDMHQRHEVYTWDLANKTFATVKLPRENMIGLADLYDPGNGPVPTLDVIGIADDQLLLRAAPRHYFMRNEDDVMPSRTWLFDMGTGDVSLVGYVGLFATN